MLNGETWELPDGYAPKRKTIPVPRVRVRLMTCNEAKSLSWGEILFQSIHGDLRRCRLNGQVKTWKTRPDDVDIPIKYGMYEAARFTMRNGRWTSEAFPVVAVKED